jgi:hypothetical protein
MYVIEYEVTKEDFFTGAKEVSVKKIFSRIPLEKGLQDVQIEHTEDNTRFWIESLKTVQTAKKSKKGAKK